MTKMNWAVRAAVVAVSLCWLVESPRPALAAEPDRGSVMLAQTSSSGRNFWATRSGVRIIVGGVVLVCAGIGSAVKKRS